MDGTLAGKRIIILFPHLTTAGGAMIYTLKLASLLAGRGATVGVLTLRADRKSFAAPAGVEIVSLDGPLTSSLAYWAFLPCWQLRINARIAAWQPDLLMPQVFPANWWGWLYRLTGGKTPLLWVCHEPSAFIHSLPWIAALTPWWKRWLARALRPLLAAADIALSRYADRMVANSRYTGGMMRKIYRRDADAIAYPGFDRDLFRPGAGETREGLITVAKLTRFKRIDFLMEVFARCLARNPELVYHIVGGGEEEGPLRALAAELGIASRVIFHGRVDNETLAWLYRRSLLFVHGSVDEPFGMAPLEAIACGTPVIAHRSGGPLEVVDGGCGRLIDSLDAGVWSEEIGNMLELLCEERAYLERVAAKAALFEWEKTLLPIVPLVEELTSPDSRGAFAAGAARG